MNPIIWNRVWKTVVDGFSKDYLGRKRLGRKRRGIESIGNTRKKGDCRFSLCPLLCVECDLEIPTIRRTRAPCPFPSWLDRRSCRRRPADSEIPSCTGKTGSSPPPRRRAFWKTRRRTPRAPSSLPSRRLSPLASLNTRSWLQVKYNRGEIPNC